MEVGEKPQKDRLRTRKEWFPKGKGKKNFLKLEIHSVQSQSGRVWEGQGKLCLIENSSFGVGTQVDLLTLRAWYWA